MRCLIERSHPRDGGFLLCLGYVGADGPAVRAVGSMGDWNQARDGDTAEYSRTVQLDFVRMSDFV